MTSPKEIVGSNIKNIRLEMGLNGVELADLLMCSQQHVSRIERGAVRLNMVQILHIADCLNVSVNVLLKGVGFQYNPLDNLCKLENYFQAEDLFTTSNSARDKKD